MRFKLDENADPQWRVPLEQESHEVSTVAEESLHGAEDAAVAATCQAEKRCLITVDQDFAQVLDYPPHEYAGLIILRHPKPTLAGMELLVRQVAAAISQESPIGRLWIVEPGRIRIHQPHDDS